MFILPRQISSIDGQHVARHPRRVRRRQEHRAAGDVVGRAEARAERVRRDEVLVHLGRALGLRVRDPVDHGAIGEAGGEGVDVAVLFVSVLAWVW